MKFNILSTKLYSDWLNLLYIQISTLTEDIQKYWPTYRCGTTSTCHRIKGSFWAHEVQLFPLSLTVYSSLPNLIYTKLKFETNINFLSFFFFFSLLFYDDGHLKCYHCYSMVSFFFNFIFFALFFFWNYIYICCFI